MPNKFNFELSRLSLNDIDNIWTYTAQKWTKSQANKYYKNLFKDISLICKNPDIGKRIEFVKPKHRIFKSKSHLIIYKLDNQKIWIDRILHERMDIENKLKE